MLLIISEYLLTYLNTIVADMNPIGSINKLYGRRPGSGTE
jgi:hypothetical protein